MDCSSRCRSSTRMQTNSNHSYPVAQTRRRNNMSKRLIVIPAFVVTIILASCAFVLAQQPQSTDGPGQMQPLMPPPPPDLADAMFPPEMIMQHARELNLTAEQKTF